MIAWHDDGSHIPTLTPWPRAGWCDVLECGKRTRGNEWVPDGDGGRFVVRLCQAHATTYALRGACTDYAPDTLNPDPADRDACARRAFTGRRIMLELIGDSAFFVVAGVLFVVAAWNGEHS